jgi:cytochrome c55X
MNIVVLLALMGISTITYAELSLQRQQQLVHLIKHDCGSCHGMTLQGGLGPSLLPSAIADKNQQMLFNTLRDGRAGTAMPPWKNLLSEEEMKWLIDQLISGL